MKHCSVTQFIKNDPKKDAQDFQECDDTKEINYYVLEARLESFTTNDITTEYSQTARVDKEDKIWYNVEKLLQKGGSISVIDLMLTIFRKLFHLSVRDSQENTLTQIFQKNQKLKSMTLTFLESSIPSIVQQQNLAKINTFIIYVTIQIMILFQCMKYQRKLASQLLFELDPVLCAPCNIPQLYLRVIFCCCLEEKTVYFNLLL